MYTLQNPTHPYSQSKTDKGWLTNQVCSQFSSVKQGPWKGQTPGGTPAFSTWLVYMNVTWPWTVTGCLPAEVSNPWEHWLDLRGDTPLDFITYLKYRTRQHAQGHLKSLPDIILSGHFCTYLASNRYYGRELLITKNLGKNRDRCMLSLPKLKCTPEWLAEITIILC